MSEVMTRNQAWGNQEEFSQTMQIVERRKQRRLALCWHIRLSSPTRGTIETKSENLSSRGFYCVLEDPLVPGNMLDCILTVPKYGATGLGTIGSIECQVEVVRVEARGAETGFGVACRILDFKLGTNRDTFNGGSFND